MILASCLLPSGCNMKVKYLPQIEAPYMAQIEFLKQVSQQEGDIQRKRFKNNKIEPAFYVYLKINNIENQGTVTIRFYRSSIRMFREGLAKLQAWLDFFFLPGKGVRMITERDVWQTIELLQAMGRDLFKMLSRSYLAPSTLGIMQIGYPYFEQVRTLNFSFGEADKYFEYIIFIDRMENLKPGKYRYAVFLNNLLLAENKFIVHSKK